ncbi:MAG: hypothetical protein KTR31_35530 [Myxococcales bacterium]|nr:hypothetical protein [Myxococcales bacterium]
MLHIALVALSGPAQAADLSFVDVAPDVRWNWITTQAMARPTVSFGRRRGDRSVFVTSLGASIPTGVGDGDVLLGGGFVREQFRIYPGANSTNGPYIAPHIAAGVTVADLCIFECSVVGFPYVDGGLSIGADKTSGKLHYGVEVGVDLAGPSVRVSLGGAL